MRWANTQRKPSLPLAQCNLFHSIRNAIFNVLLSLLLLLLLSSSFRILLPSCFCWLREMNFVWFIRWKCEKPKQSTFSARIYDSMHQCVDERQVRVCVFDCEVCAFNCFNKLNFRLKTNVNSKCSKPLFNTNDDLLFGRICDSKRHFATVCFLSWKRCRHCRIEKEIDSTIIDFIVVNMMAFFLCVVSFLWWFNFKPDPNEIDYFHTNTHSLTW